MSTRTPAVPYCTVKGFRTSLDILRRDPPAVVDRQSLVDRGLSPHAVYPVLGALRFLGIVDEDGRIAAPAAPFLDERDVAGRRRVVEAAYRDVLATVGFPVEEREVVDRILMERHDVAPGVAAFCATFFLWLAAEAGLPVAEMQRHRRGRPPAHLAQLSEAAREALVRATPAARRDGLDELVTLDPARPAESPLRQPASTRRTATS